MSSTAQTSFRARRLSLVDRIRLGSLGLTTRRLRAALSALGIAIGIAAMVGVLGLSDSARAGLVEQLDRLGTNLLTVKPGQTMLGESASLPEQAPEMISRMPSVEASAAIYALNGVTVRKTDLVPETDTGGIGVYAADSALPETLGARLATGSWLNDATGTLPAVVLGAATARRLGISDVSEAPMVWLGGEWFTVAGILDPVTLAPALDDAALIGISAALELTDADDLPPSTVFVRADPDAVTQTSELLGATANPEHPDETSVSRPSDALAAQVAAEGAFTSLFLGLGVVALLVGGVGIANVMVISVLERRREIGLRRALGATRFDVASQFLIEALLLSGLGGVAGAVIGTAVVWAYAPTQGWAVVVPPAAILGGVGAALIIGTLAGLYPSAKAARLTPAEALRTT